MGKILRHGTFQLLQLLRLVAKPVHWLFSVHSFSTIQLVKQANSLENDSICSSVNIDLKLFFLNGAPAHFVKT